MGSSHSYLQNLYGEAGTTPVHWVKAGLCFQLDVPDNKVHQALTSAGAAGKCSDSGYTKFDYNKQMSIPGEGVVTFGIWSPSAAVPTLVAAAPTATVARVAIMPVNHDDEESRYSWEVHCATAAGKAKYAYCANPEPSAGGSSAPVMTTAPTTTVTTMPVNHDDEESRYSWTVHCATAAGRAKYAYCANPEPSAGGAYYSKIPVSTTVPTNAIVVTMPVNHDDEESRYSWEVHCATAAGRAKYAYCANPEPSAGGSSAPVIISTAPTTTVTTMPVNHDDEESRYSWTVHCATAAGRAKYAYCANPEPSAGGAYYSKIPVSTTVPTTAVVVAMPVNHDDEESKYSWTVHCATAAGRAKYAYCANPEPSAGEVQAPVTTAASSTTVVTMPVNHDDEESRYSWTVHCATAADRAKYSYCANPEPAAIIIML